jgi:hypothetical protein
VARTGARVHADRHDIEHDSGGRPERSTDSHANPQPQPDANAHANANAHADANADRRSEPDTDP